jgi:hypothetical protein
MPTARLVYPQLHVAVCYVPTLRYTSAHCFIAFLAMSHTHAVSHRVVVGFASELFSSSELQGSVETVACVETVCSL